MPHLASVFEVLGSFHIHISYKVNANNIIFLPGKMMKDIFNVQNHKEFLKCYEMSEIPNFFALLLFQAAFKKMFGNTEISDYSKDVQWTN